MTHEGGLCKVNRLRRKAQVRYPAKTKR